jgi:hypothetical protein
MKVCTTLCSTLLVSTSVSGGIYGVTAWIPPSSASITNQATRMYHTQHQPQHEKCWTSLSTKSSRTKATSATTTIPTTTTALHLSSEVARGSSTSSSTVPIVAFTQPDRIVMEELPTLYVYDHCPFCVRVRLALGIKNVKHNLHFLANDDSKTPTSLVGKKIAPIFVRNVT